MNIALLQKINQLPDEIQEIIKKVGDSCFNSIKEWTKENWEQPIENPIENFIQYGGEKENIQFLENEGYFSLTKAWLKESAIAAGAIITNEYFGTSEVAEQAGTSYETAKKWASKNNVKKSTYGKKSVYQWTEIDIQKFIERGKK